MSVAQNQHYVPKFILRQFLCSSEKEQVFVYDKHKDKQFITSINNIMAERRYNDFYIDTDLVASAEGIACGIEDMCLPAYRRVLMQRRLPDDPEDHAALAFLIAFQFIRTKARRDSWKQMESALAGKIALLVGNIEDIKRREQSNENSIKRHHLINMTHHVGEFAQCIASKDFKLFEPCAGRSFYLGDNPVALHNQREFGAYGNIGLAVPGIEIYMPLSADLLIAAWCPTIIGSMESDLSEAQRTTDREMIKALCEGRVSIAQAVKAREGVSEARKNAECQLEQLRSREAISSNEDNMDFLNSLQTMYAYRYLISKDKGVDLARRHNAEFPKYRFGMRPTFS